MRRTLLALSLLLAPSLAAAQFPSGATRHQAYYGCFAFGCSVGAVTIGWESQSSFLSGDEPMMLVTFTDYLHPNGGQSAAVLNRSFALPDFFDPGWIDWEDFSIPPNSRCVTSYFDPAPTTCDLDWYMGRVPVDFAMPATLGVDAMYGTSGTYGDYIDLIYNDVPPAYPFRTAFALSAVPEPSSIALIGTGLAALAATARRRQRRRLA